VLGLVLPQCCVACGAGGAQLCTRCVDALPRLDGTLCERCGAPTSWPVARCRDCAGRRLAFASSRAAVEYDAAVRAFVAAWKEQGLRRLAATAADIVVDVVPKPEGRLLTFVPPDGDRSLKRGHHPPERLARELGSHWGIPVRDLLRRTRDMGRQRGLSRLERRSNVAGAFRPTDTAPARVVLVDDVYTSGATASAVASALRAAGARRVDVVTFARATRTGRS
jgi:predicted amidophosphoribosyltransferase